MNDTINRVMNRRLNDLPLTYGEQQLVDWQYKRLGGFTDSLWKAISQADTYNLAKLELAFPSEVSAYRNFVSMTGYWKSVKEQAVKQGFISAKEYVV